MTVNETKSAYSADSNINEEELDEILFNFAREGDSADVKQWLRRYPEYAREISSYAAFRWADSVLATVPIRDEELVITPERVGEIGRETLAAFRAEYEAKKAAAAAAAPALTSLVEAAKARGLDPAQLAARLDVPRTLVTKLHRRLIAAESVPRAFAQSLADALGRSLDDIRAYLRQPPAMAVGASFRADDTPAVGAQQTFADAVSAAPDATDAQRARWLNGED